MDETSQSTKIALMEKELEYLRNKVEVLENLIPSTNLLSKSFWKRSFTVWGHMLVAQLIVGAIFFVFFACLASISGYSP